MKPPITTAQAMQHPDVVTTINTLGQMADQLRTRLAEVEKDAARLDWLRDNLFVHKWNGVVGSGCTVQWQVAPDFRFRQRELTENSGIMAGDFRRAVDAAIDAAMKEKA